LTKLIDDAVEMARLDTTHIDVHPQISDVQETIREAIAPMESEIDDRLLEIVCDKQPSEIAFDRRLMKLAVKQIIDNALKYSPADKPVTIRVLDGNGILTIEITDHGAGIPVEEQAQIFRRFYRSPCVKDQIPGSGLGLSIAHSIVQAHSGDLTVTSRPGETTFRITLPTGDPGEQK
jgi:two-component system, OmpR family, sensor histidine kinase KdpD